MCGPVVVPFYLFIIFVGVFAVAGLYGLLRLFASEIKVVVCGSEDYDTEIYQAGDYQAGEKK